jgi:aryl-alcohol dehydrogenase-like predicted oxidoreductase/enamine deaminase RidA (YjgF/YER057c/UK114 family)
MTARPDLFELAPGLEMSRVVTGLWQVGDMEKQGQALDTGRAADHLDAYVADGFTTFDMADHYGSAELIAGAVLKRHAGPQRPLAFTKWCPEPGPMTGETVRSGVQERLDRLGIDKIDLLQFHWWTFEHPAWLDALHEMTRLKQEGLIGAIGVTNFDAAHLAVALAEGIPIISNQVSFSLIDRRAAGALSEVCRHRGVKLLAYGTLCGGFLSQRWLGQQEPTEIPDWSGMKYRRFIEAAGGWEAYQCILAAASEIAAKHKVSASNVATRWVLEHDTVAGVIIGARLGQSEHRADNAQLFGFSLDAEDNERLADAFAASTPIPGDCGDEYRRPPYLTASGDLSHHLDSIPSVFSAAPVAGRPHRSRVTSSSVWEPIAGYSRAVRVGNRILISGTTATHGADRVVAPGDAGAQTTYCLDKIAASIRALGGTTEDVIRTRVYLSDVSDWEAVSRAHGRFFGDVRPANTLLAVASLVGDYKVEIEAEAEV